MKVLRGIPTKQMVRTAMTIGNFDGVHLGHQAMIRRVCAQGRKLGVRSSLMSFEPQPREFFDAKTAPARLTTMREKLELLKQTKIDQVYLINFNSEFSQLTADNFVNKILLERLHVCWLLIGDDFRFGAKRMGDSFFLKKISREKGFTFETMPSLEYAGARISSTLVRNLLNDGKLEQVKNYLGRNYSISGRVEKGDRYGRQIGFPTANLGLKTRNVELRGIFAVKVSLDKGPLLNGVASLGVRPTVKSDPIPLLEVNIFNFNKYIYGKYIRVEFLKKLRDEKKFDTVEEMVFQMHQDKSEAIEFLENM